MKHINLNDNTFTATGGKAMAENALPLLNDLEIINFGDCLVRTEGAEAIATILENSSFHSLKEINLSFNEIQKQGAIKIAEAAAGLPALAKLELNGNQVGEEACEIIKDIMVDGDKHAVLGSFSDDEGSDAEDGSDEEEENEEEVSDSSHDASNLSIQEVSPEVLENVTAADVLLCPTKEKIFALDGGPHADGLRAKNELMMHLGPSVSDRRAAIRAFLKLSTVLQNKNEDHLYEVICLACDDILRTHFRNITPEGDSRSDTMDESTNLFTNELLVQMGLLKSEDKNLNLVTRQLWAPTYVLDHLIQQEYFPRRTKEVLQVFFSSTNKTLDSMKDMRHQIMRTLFSS